MLLESVGLQLLILLQTTIGNVHQSLRYASNVLGKQVDIVLIEGLVSHLLAVLINRSDGLNNRLHTINGELFEIKKLLLQLSSFHKSRLVFPITNNLPI